MTRRLTHCPLGRPLYRVNEIPPHLATVTMLKQQRRRLADGQQPVASLLYAGNEYTGLYEIAGSVPMPALSPRRQAAWDKARTCARCGTRSGTPTPVADTRAWGSRRLCVGCDRAESLADVRPSWLRLRAAAVVWAGEVLADPATVLVAAFHRQWGWPMEVHAVTPAGEVLVDVTVVPTAVSSRRVLQAGVIVADEIVPYLMPLAGRRLVHTVRDGRGHLADHVTPLGMVADLTRVWRWEPSLCDGIRQDVEDGFRPRWTDWHGRPWASASSHYYGRTGLSQVDVDGEHAAELTAAMRAGLTAMATDDHPDGPAVCPALSETGVDPCGAPPLADTGRCSAHGGDE